MALKGTSIRLDEDMWEALKVIAKRENRSVGNLIRYVLLKYLDKYKQSTVVEVATLLHCAISFPKIMSRTIDNALKGYTTHNLRTKEGEYFL